MRLFPRQIFTAVAIVKLQQLADKKRLTNRWFGFHFCANGAVDNKNKGDMVPSISFFGVGQVSEIRGRVVATTETQAVSWKSGDKTPVAAVIKYDVFNAVERKKRAMTVAGILIAAGLASAVIPIVHFVSVPGLIIAGIVIGAKINGTERVPSRSEGQCPVCGKSVQIKLESNDKVPVFTYCTACNSPIQIVEPQPAIEKAEPA